MTYPLSGGLPPRVSKGPYGAGTTEVVPSQIPHTTNMDELAVLAPSLGLLAFVVCVVLLCLLTLKALVWVVRQVVGRTIGLFVAWLFGAFRDASPPLLPAEGFDRVVEAGSVRGVYGLACRQAGGFAEPSTALFVARLRRRARWLRALEAVLGGKEGVVGTILRGRWCPDQPALSNPDVQNYLLASFESGARILGGGFIGKDNTPGEEAPVADADSIYFLVDVGGQVELVFPALLGKLRQYALGRERTGELFGALKTRAMGWCKGVMGSAHHISDMAVASAVSLAMEPSTHERRAVARVHQAIQNASSLSPPPLLS